MNYIQTDTINYTDINLDQRTEINGYLEEFGYKILNDAVNFGWIYQINKSVGNGSFIFAPEAFRATEQELVHKTDIGMLYGDGIRDWGPTNMFGNFKGPNSSFDKFCDTFKKDANSVPYDGQGSDDKELFFARMFNAITTLIGNN